MKFVFIEEAHAQDIVHNMMLGLCVSSARAAVYAQYIQMSLLVLKVQSAFASLQKTSEKQKPGRKPENDTFPPPVPFLHRIAESSVEASSQ